MYYNILWCIPINSIIKSYKINSQKALFVILLILNAVLLPIKSYAQSTQVEQYTPPPVEVQAAFIDPKLLGEAKFIFYGMEIYIVQLWANAAFQVELHVDSPLALALTYSRKLEGALIAERSIIEMRRIASFTDEQAKAWLVLMNKAFPNVKKGDRLVGGFDGKASISFYYNGVLTQSIRDREFSKNFIGIWLNKNTSAPSLRQSLLNSTIS